ESRHRNQESREVHNQQDRRNEIQRNEVEFEQVVLLYQEQNQLSQRTGIERDIACRKTESCFQRWKSIGKRWFHQQIQHSPRTCFQRSIARRETESCLQRRQGFVQVPGEKSRLTSACISCRLLGLTN